MCRGLGRAQSAVKGGGFEREIVPVEIAGRKGVEMVREDEQPLKADAAKIPTLRPAFSRDGTITAANASSISDGAAALVMMRSRRPERLGLEPVARIAVATAPRPRARPLRRPPSPAMRQALARAGWDVDDVDLFEVNEAFAVVAMIAMRELAIPRERLNVNGGACALGPSDRRLWCAYPGHSALGPGDPRRRSTWHPLCIGGGEAVAAMIVERLCSAVRRMGDGLRIKPAKTKTPGAVTLSCQVTALAAGYGAWRSGAGGPC